MPTETFTSDNSWTVPDGVTDIDILAVGARGQNGTDDGTISAPSSGAGHGVSGTLSVSSGDTIYIRTLPGGNAGASTGGKGGNGIEARLNGSGPSNAVIAGGGGGGGGHSNDPNPGGDGGAAGLPEGEGGEPDDGGNGATGPGTQTSGGAGGEDGEDGGRGYGGDSATSSDNAGGGGGGGYYGGGGGSTAFVYGSTSGGGGASSYLDSSLTNTSTSSGVAYGNEKVEITYTAPATAPDSVSATVVANDQIDVSWTSGSNVDNYRIELNRDGTSYVSPSGGPSTVSSGTTSGSYGPNSDNSYETQIGIDSSFRFRVRSENSDGSISSWTYSSTVYTDPIPPHNPSVSRPDANTFKFNWTDKAYDTWFVRIAYRIDTGSGYGSWDFLENVTSDPPFTVSVGDTTQGGHTIQSDARYQFKLRTTNAPNQSSVARNSKWVYADYGNSGNVYFEDDFESNDLSKWRNTPNAYTSSGSGMDSGFSGADQGTYYAILDGDSKIDVSVGDLSNESDVIVKATVAVGSADSPSEEMAVDFYDGSNWQQLTDFHWEYNKQGWVEMTALVPDSYLNSNSHIRFESASGGGGDHYYIDRVVVSDILHEYTKPAPPSGLTLDNSVEDEITASWTHNASLTGTDKDEVLWGVTGSGGTSNNKFFKENSTPSAVLSPVADGEKYDVLVRSVVEQDRNGTKRNNAWRADSPTSSAVTKLPAPTNLTVSNIGANTADASWTANHNYGDQRVYLRETANKAGMDFTGSNGVDVPHAQEWDLTGDTSISFWLYVDSSDFGSNRSTIFDMAYGGEFTMNLNNNTSSPAAIQTYQGSAGGNNSPYVSQYSTDFIQANTWYYVTYSRDASAQEVTYYVDGATDKTTTSWESVTASENRLRIGDGYTTELAGYMADVTIHDGLALNQSQHQQQYNGNIVMQDLVGHWPLDMNNSGTTPDVSPYSNDGSVNGATLVGNTPGSAGSFENMEEWTIVNGGTVTDRVYEGDQSYYSGADGTNEQATWTPFNGGAQPSAFSYVYQETSNSTGGGVRLVNSNGDYEGGTATNNYQFSVDFANTTGDFDSGSGYNDWVRVTWDFDWANGGVTVTFYNIANDYTASGTYTLKQGVDIERVELWNYNGRIWGDKNLDMWWDDLRFSGFSSYSLSSLLEATYYETFVQSETEHSKTRKY